jgi:elongation factor P hydroxylase
MFRLLLLQTITALVFFGCMETTHDFKIRFDDINGLREGDKVFFKESAIGDVEDVEYTDKGIFLVSVSIKEQYASTATDVCEFYVDEEPPKSDQKIIRVVQLGEGGNQLKEGAVVDGNTKYSVFYSQFAFRLGQRINILESGINEFLRELKGLSENKQIKVIERQLDKITGDLSNMSIEMKNTLEQEVMPFLKKKIEELRKSLKKAGEEEKLHSIDQKIQMITDSLQV